jgi:hypothetical protein
LVFTRSDRLPCRWWRSTTSLQILSVNRLSLHVATQSDTKIIVLVNRPLGSLKSYT